MRDFGLVRSEFWEEPRVQGLSDKEKLLALYVMTSSHGNMMGCFRMPLGYLAADFRWERTEVESCLAALETIDFLTYDRKCEWLVIHDFLVWNRIDNINHGKNIAKLFEKIPEGSSVLPRLIMNLQPYQKYFDAVFQARLEGVATQVPMPVQTCIPTPVKTPISTRMPTKDKEKERDKDKEREKEKESAREKLLDPVPSTEDVTTPTLPLNDGTEFIIPQALITEWQSLYSSVDVLQTLRHIRGWSLSNPQKQKSKDHILNHVTWWLKEEQLKAMKPQPPPLADHNQAVVEQWLKSHSEHIIEGEFSHDA